MRSLALAVLLLSACGQGQGAEGSHCYPNGTCDVGLVCVSNRCVVEPSSGLDAGATTDGSPDATTPDAWRIRCGTDLGIEPNDDVAHAAQTPVRSSQTEYMLSRLAICPYTDVDVYGFDTTALGENVRISLTYDPAQGQLAMQLLTRGGQSAGYEGHANGNTITIATNLLPVDQWYVQVDAASPGVENNYDLDISVTP